MGGPSSVAAEWWTCTMGHGQPVPQDCRWGKKLAGPLPCPVLALCRAGRSVWLTILYCVATNSQFFAKQWALGFDAGAEDLLVNPYVLWGIATLMQNPIVLTGGVRERCQHSCLHHTFEETWNNLCTVLIGTHMHMAFEKMELVRNVLAYMPVGLPLQCLQNPHTQKITLVPMCIYIYIFCIL